MDDAKLRRALDQVRLRLQDGGEGLIEIGRHLAEISACRVAPAIPKRHGFDGHPPRLATLPPAQPTGPLAADRTPRWLMSPCGSNCSARANSSCANLRCGVALVESGNAGMQQGHLVVDVLDGVLQFPAPAPGLCFDTAHRGRGRLQIRLRGIDRRFLFGDRDLVGLLVQLGEKISLANTVVVIDQNPGNLAADAGSNERHMAIHICVIRRNGIEGQFDPGNSVDPDGSPPLRRPARQ